MINLENFSEWFHNILEEANIIDSRYPIKGMSVWLPYGYQIRKYMLNVYRDLLDKDHEEVLFPLLIPEAELAKEGKHVKGFEDHNLEDRQIVRSGHKKSRAHGDDGAPWTYFRHTDGCRGRRDRAADGHGSSPR